MKGIARIRIRSCIKWCVCCLCLLFAFQFPSRSIFVLFLRCQSPRSASPFLSCNGFSRSSFQGNSLWINQICTRHLLWVQFQLGSVKGWREGNWAVRPKVYLSSTIPSLDRFLVLLAWIKIKKIHTHTHNDTNNNNKKTETIGKKWKRVKQCLYHQSHPQLGVVFTLAPSLHSFWSYFSTDLQ